MKNSKQTSPLKGAHPEKVNPDLAREAMRTSKERGALYSRYILASYHATGSLVPGCDNIDLLAWFEANMPDELNAITIVKKRGA